MDEIRERLFALQDLQYKAFSSKLMPNVDPATVIGIRTPELRKLAKAFSREEGAAAFLKALPHAYFEEYNLHGMVVEQIKDYDRCVEALDEFLPYVDNWATCDLVSPRVLGKHKDRLLEDIRRWMTSERPYTIRFGVEMLMRHYLDADFRPEYLDWVSEIRSEEYYVNMMTAWFFATALAKQYEAAVVSIQERKLDQWTHNKAIQKAIESYRISAEQKTYLRSLKWK